MAQHLLGLYHFHERKRKKKNHPDKEKKFIDTVIFFMIFLVPVGNLPQLVKIWNEKNISGVSLMSWAIFSCFSFVWIIYGVIHKEKPIIFMNILLLITQLMIIFGIILLKVF